MNIVNNIMHSHIIVSLLLGFQSFCENVKITYKYIMCTGFLKTDQVVTNHILYTYVVIYSCKYIHITADAWEEQMGLICNITYVYQYTYVIV